MLICVLITRANMMASVWMGWTHLPVNVRMDSPVLTVKEVSNYVLTIIISTL